MKVWAVETPGAGSRQAVVRWREASPGGAGDAGEELGTARSWSYREGMPFLAFLLSSHLLSKPNRMSEAFEGWEPSHTVAQSRCRKVVGALAGQ